MSKNIIAVLLLLLVGSFIHADTHAVLDGKLMSQLMVLDLRVLMWTGRLDISNGPGFSDYMESQVLLKDAEVTKTLNLMSCYGVQVVPRLEQHLLDTEQWALKAFTVARVEYEQWMSPIFLLYVEKLNVLLAKACQFWSAQAYAFLTADSLDLTAAERKQLALASEAVEKSVKQHNGLANYYSIIAHGIPWPKFTEDMDILSDRLKTITIDDVAEPREYLKNMAQARLNGLPAWIATNSMAPVNEMSNLYIMAMVKRYQVYVESINKELDLYRPWYDKLSKLMKKRERWMSSLLRFRSPVEDDPETSALHWDIQREMEKLHMDLSSAETFLRQYEIALEERYEAIRTVSLEFKGIVEGEFQKVQQGIWQEESSEFSMSPAQLQSDLGYIFNLLRTSDYSWEMFMLPPRPGMELEALEVGAKVHYIMASHLYRHWEF
ncbi:hypothetical protein SeLEV6574_g00523 [Synchytrium endobioticum]|uniref:Dynein heavy chain linker domain-containing protein n=1 Tax=Synchytrium endobioticum TaxID=286115 RepID=A0A507DHJ3_9FUNG|nr:hypothetical protein SeLEV6574_g00514 [Synchytrium endobioticum]TPX51064.1 hypothetical protein SeLEV6574_g00523 [Synchytrium endobioticum]